jgi:hypothetical protein
VRSATVAASRKLLHKASLAFRAIITPEIAHWRAKCKCKLSVYVIEDTSHDFPLHKSAASTVNEMSKWLKSF